MTSASHLSPDEHFEEDYNKVCEGLGCQNKAMKKLDLPFGEHGSTFFYLCETCADKIQ
jgi:hypothetical protein